MDPIKKLKSLNKKQRQWLAIAIIFLIFIIMVTTLIYVLQFDRTCDGCVERGECSRSPTCFDGPGEGNLPPLETYDPDMVGSSQDNIAGV
jgi:hypothetical protein